jgi:hypothetical protein
MFINSNSIKNLPYQYVPEPMARFTESDGSVRIYLGQLNCVADPPDADPSFKFDTDPDLTSQFDAEPVPAYHSNADLDPASQNDADPCGSGSAKYGMLSIRIRIRIQFRKC